MLRRRLPLLVVLLLAASQAFAAGKTGTVTVNCPVVGATVLVDGEEVGLVPIDPFELKFGNHEIRIVRAGLIAFAQKVTLRPGEEIVVTAFPKEPRSLLSVETAVQGAEVLVDGKLLGKTPLRDAPIAPGRHSVFIRKDGLLPYKEDVVAPPHREAIMRPQLKNKDGSPAGGLVGGLLASAAGAPKGGGLGMDLDLDEGPAKPLPKPTSSGLDLDLDLAPAKPAAKSADLDLDIGLAPIASNAKPAATDLDLDLDLGDLPPAGDDLDLDLDLPPPPAPATTVAANTPNKPGPALAFADKPVAQKPAAQKPAAQRPPQVAQRPRPQQRPQAKPQPRPQPPPQVATFVADPIEEEKSKEPPGPPIYTQNWFWGTAAGAAAVTIGVMLYTSRYIEERNPEAISACAGGLCPYVMNQ